MASNAEVASWLGQSSADRSQCVLFGYGPSMRSRKNIQFTAAVEPQPPGVGMAQCIRSPIDAHFMRILFSHCEQASLRSLSRSDPVVLSCDAGQKARPIPLAVGSRFGSPSWSDHQPAPPDPIIGLDQAGFIALVGAKAVGGHHSETPLIGFWCSHDPLDDLVIGWHVGWIHCRLFSEWHPDLGKLDPADQRDVLQQVIKLFVWH